MVGAGIVGSSACWALAARGHEVTLFDQFLLGHDKGSSHGRTRIVRRAYPDAFWTAIMTEAYPIWAEVESGIGKKLIDPCGLLYFGDQASPRVTAMIAALEENDVPHQVLRSGEASGALPRLALGDHEVGVLTPEAGVIQAAEALKGIQRLAFDAGARFVQQKVDPRQLRENFDAVVLAAGPWLPDHARLPCVQVTMQTFGYADLDVRGAVWIDDTTLAYGFPSDDWGMKIGAHDAGPALHPDEGRAEYLPHHEQIRRTLKERFGAPDAQVSRFTICLYTSFDDEMFRMGTLDEGIVFASACSGHGFKLGPWVGRTLANVVEGADIPVAFRA